jgi:hypothetical protein
MFYRQCNDCGQRWKVGMESTCKCPDETLQHTWVGLTDEQIEAVWRNVQANDFHDCVQPFARAIEARLKAKNDRP